MITRRFFFSRFKQQSQPPPGKPLRILFLHAACDDKADYTVHRLLAEHANPNEIESYFIWQAATKNQDRNLPVAGAAVKETTFWDFGRDLSLSPRPSRQRRALMMARRLPASLYLIHQTIRKIQPHVIYTSQQKYDLFLVSLIRLLHPLPHQIHLHYKIEPVMGRMVLRTLQRAVSIITVSHFLRDNAIAAGITPQRITALHNPADIRRFAGDRDRRYVQDTFNLPPDAPVIIAVGRLDPSKGHMLLLDAFARLIQEVPNARLIICGETFTRTHYDLQLKRYCMKLGLGDRVIFAGQRSDLPAIFAGADVFCLPSIDDPCPLVFLEAMAAGLPVVGVRSGGVPEIIGDAGLLVEPGDAAGLAERLLHLLRDPALAHRLAQKGRRRVTTSFDPKRVAQRWTTLLRHLYAMPPGADNPVSKAEALAAIAEQEASPSLSGS